MSHKIEINAGKDWHDGLCENVERREAGQSLAGRSDSIQFIIKAPCDVSASGDIRA